MGRFIPALIGAGLIAVSASASAAGPLEQRMATAVIAADNAWTAAEIRGDAVFVDALLLPEYKSIGADGKVATKAQIVGSTQKRGSHSDFGAQVDAYRATHPTRADVSIAGDSAVLTWVSLVPGRGEPVASCDIFVYRGGRWRALYSQHTSAEA